MIDFIKIILKDFDHPKLECNPLLNFFDTINLTTGELKTVSRNGNKVTPCKNASYNGLEFKIYDTGTITITGSLHKYWNEGKHNYNDFNSEAVSEVLNDLKIKFGIEPKQCILKCLEIGINITPPIQTNEILDNCLLHKTKPFEYQKNSFAGRYKQVQHSQYFIKLYNKALHYTSQGFKIPTEIMRFEIKYTKMEKLNKMGIYTLQELIDYGLHNFKNELLNEWQKVLFFDNTIQIDPLSKKLEITLLKYSKEDYWLKLLSNNQKKNFTYHKNQLRKITTNHSENLQNQIAEIIAKKIDFLTINTILSDSIVKVSKRIVLNK